MHRGQLRVKNDCTLMVLEADQFQKIISPFPTPHAGSYGEAFVDMLNDGPAAELSDVTELERSMKFVLKHAFPDKIQIEPELDRASGMPSVDSGQSSYHSDSGHSTFGSGHN